MSSGITTAISTLFPFAPLTAGDQTVAQKFPTGGTPSVLDITPEGVSTLPNGQSQAGNPNFVLAGNQYVNPLINAASGVLPTVIFLPAAPTTPLPSGYTNPPSQLSAATFESWPANTQAAYAQAHATGTPPSVTIGSALGSPIDVVLSANGQTAYVIQSLTTQTSIDNIPPADYVVLERSSAFQAQLKSTGLSIDPTTFERWPSAYQVAYAIAQNGKTPPLTLPLTSPIEVTIGSGSGAINGVVSADGTKLYIIQNFNDPSTLSNLSAADLALLNQVPAFGTQLQSIGLSNNSAAVQNVVNSLQDVIQGILNGTAAEPTKTYTPPAGAASMSASDKQVFVNEVTLLEAQVTGQTVVYNADGSISLTGSSTKSIVSATNIANQLKLVTDRFNLVASFAAGANVGTTYQSAGGTTIGYGNNSPDGGASFTSAYNSMLSQEKQILSLAESAQQAASGPIPGNIDAPQLIYEFQLNANLTGEAEVAVQTQELNQLNTLLGWYNQMQTLVNNAIASFPAGSSDTATEPLLGGSPNVNAGDQTSEIVAMFNTGGYTASPLESLFGVKRPQQGLFSANTSKGATTSWSYASYDKQTWTTFGDELSAQVTQLNEQSQILTNAISSQQTQDNRHFELGNNTLQQMAQMIQTISTNTESSPG
jgi:hypothetical protein